MINSIFRSLVILSFGLSAATYAAEKQINLDDQTAVAITIYNSNLALIKDQRKVRLTKGVNYLAFRGISAKIRPETAMLRSLSDKGAVKVIEQNFDYDLLTPKALLKKYVGKEIQVVRVNPATGKETVKKATVLSVHQGVVLKINGRIETNFQGRFIFDNIPENLRDQPTLVTQLTSLIAKSQQLELSYLSGGLSWKADYVVELNESDNQLDLLGWVTLNNESGTGYKNAKLQLVAGDVNQVSFRHVSGFAQQTRVRSMMIDSAPMSEESLFEYHLYTLNHPTSILNHQTKQVSLLTASSVPVSKSFELVGADYYYHGRYGNVAEKMKKVAVYVQFDNKKSAGLGLPIPKGVVRVYKKDSQGHAQFVGEDRIDHTAKNELIRLKLGNAFDITANKKQMDFKTKTSVLPARNAFESAFEIELKNAKSEAVTVVVREPIPGDWTMIKENYTHKKVSSGMAEWKVTIPAESRKTLRYRVFLKY